MCVAIIAIRADDAVAATSIVGGDVVVAEIILRYGRERPLLLELLHIIKIGHEVVRLLQVGIALHGEVTVDGYFGIVDDVGTTVGIDIVHGIEQTSARYLVLQTDIYARGDLAHVVGAVQMILQPVHAEARRKAELLAQPTVVGQKCQRLAFPQMLPEFGVLGVVRVPDVVIMVEFSGEGSFCQRHVVDACGTETVGILRLTDTVLIVSFTVSAVVFVAVIGEVCAVIKRLRIAETVFAVEVELGRQAVLRGLGGERLIAQSCQG